MKVPAIDKRALKNLYELQDDADPNLVADLIRIFLDLAPERIGRMSEALRDGDARRLEGEAHDLKSSAANLGAMALSTAAANLEKIGRSGEITEAPRALERLREEMKQAQQELTALLDTDS